MTEKDHTGKDEKFRRFEMSEVYLHWANGAPFLALLVSGGLILATRFFNVSAELLHALVIAHKISAVLWLLLLGISFFFFGLKLNLKNLRDVFSIGKNDIKWMISAVRSVYNSKVQVPPVGKFNIGQKINTLLVVFYSIAFPVTGIIMWFHNTLLLTWYIHAAIFFMASSSVSGHLYLSFLHPSTRIGLWGIFNGWVPMRYIAHHHALSLTEEQKRHEDQTHTISESERKVEGKYAGVEITILLVTLIFGIAGLRVFDAGRRAEMGKQFNFIIRPSELSGVHQIKETQDCKKCHDIAGALKDEKCLECHKFIGYRMEEKIGYHGNHKGTCKDCHKEHPLRGSIISFDKDKFDHNLAQFKQEGKHKELKCDDCHKKLRTEKTPGIYYIGLKFKLCSDCHKDPHDKVFEQQCDSCHSPAGWKGKDLKFDHDKDSKYALKGKHAALKCVQCHQPKQKDAALSTAVFRGLKHELCSDCHKDPHSNNVGNKCELCHTNTGWKGKDLKFEHNRDSKYVLEGKHISAKCDKCHRPKQQNAPLASSVMRGLRSKLCSDCHKDPHENTLDDKCRNCHNYASWKGNDLNFDHNRDSKFTLEGKHSKAKCVECHKPRAKDAPLATSVMRGLKSKLCSDCHKDPHSEGLGEQCRKCHNYASWKGNDLNFDHNRDSKFTLEGKHITAKCIDCHKPPAKDAPLASSVMRGLKSKLCTDCHKDPHENKIGATCTYCHSFTGWKKKRGK